MKDEREKPASTARRQGAPSSATGSAKRAVNQQDPNNILREKGLPFHAKYEVSNTRTNPSHLEVGSRHRKAGAGVVAKVSGVRAHGAEGEQRPPLVVKRESHYRAAWVPGNIARNTREE